VICVTISAEVSYSIHTAGAAHFVTLSSEAQWTLLDRIVSRFRRYSQHSIIPFRRYSQHSIIPFHSFLSSCREIISSFHTGVKIHSVSTHSEVVQYYNCKIIKFERRIGDSNVQYILSSWGEN
jgi:hypothetical protein